MSAHEMQRPIIEIRGLTKSFAGEAVLNGIDLDVQASQLTALIGPSGCGKSTLLRCLSGLEVFEKGRVSVNGFTLQRDAGDSQVSKEYIRTTHGMRGIMGMVFQAFNLFPHMTALDNVARPVAIVRRVPLAEARSKALRLLEKVGLADRARLYPHQLSGGQQQRAAIARALAMKPIVMLYDEPTSALDPELVDEVLEVMKGLNSEGITQLVVTHEMQFARDVAQKIVFLSGGRVVEEGRPEDIFTHPSQIATQQFLRRFL